jgi:uncharacterized membrane-anchored protein YhcB (DUF1043 family)
MDPTVLLLLTFAGGAIAGALVATWLERRGGRAAYDRAAELEIELAKTRSELEAQGVQIATHFARTSDLFRDLTGQYTQLYAHLAEGARQFCREDVPEIARGLEGLLPAGEAEAEAESEPSPPEEDASPHPAAQERESPPQV